MVDGEKAATTTRSGGSLNRGHKRPCWRQLKHQRLVAVFHRALISAIFKKVETLLDAVSPR